MERGQCQLKNQGLDRGSCSLRDGNQRSLACRTTLKAEEDGLYRLVNTVHLSRPENYLSVYQSGCNMACRKCHSWTFSKVKKGRWYSPEDILQAAKDYEEKVTLFEPRERLPGMPRRVVAVAAPVLSTDSHRNCAPANWHLNRLS